MELTDDRSTLRYQGYIPGLDVLRGMAILAVLVYHALDGRVPWQAATGWMRWPLFAAQYGAAGVQLFFMLSGFLISSILLDTAGSADYYKKFYVRRFLRIMPAYLLMLIVLKAVHVVSWKFVLAAVLYIANMAGLVGAHTYEYAALWSLAVEEQFYLIWPLLVRRCSLRTLTGVIVGWFVFALLLRLAGLVLVPGVDVVYKLWFNADWLLAGALIAISLRRGWLRRENIGQITWTLAGLAVVTFPLSVFVALQQSYPVWIRALAAFALYPQNLAFAAMLLLVIRTNRGPGGRQTPVARLLGFFGYVSYGLYLVHPLVFSTFDRLVRGTWLGNYTTDPASLVVNSVIVIGLSTGIAYLSRRYFEEFFLRKKDKVVPYRDPAVNERPEPA